jgi:Tfp pilus assembly protein PilV
MNDPLELPLRTGGHCSSRRTTSYSEAWNGNGTVAFLNSGCAVASRNACSERQRATLTKRKSAAGEVLLCSLLEM